MSTQYQVGEVVRAVIDAARVDQVDETTDTVVVVSVGAAQVVLPLDEELVCIARVAPADWPPQPGDIWAQGGQRWYVAEANRSDIEGGVVMVSRHTNERYREPGDLLQYGGGPLALVYREGWTAQPAVTQ